MMWLSGLAPSHLTSHLSSVNSKTKKDRLMRSRFVFDVFQHGWEIGVGENQLWDRRVQVLGKVVYIISEACPSPRPYPPGWILDYGAWGGGRWGWDGYMGGMGVSRKGSDPPITSATNKGAGRPDGNWWWLSCWLGGRNSYRRRGPSCREPQCKAPSTQHCLGLWCSDAQRGPQIHLCHGGTTCMARSCWIGNIPSCKNRPFIKPLALWYYGAIC